MRVSWLSYLAEYIGVFFFIFVIFVSGGNPYAIGAALAFAIYMVADISGGHINPAVSFAMMLDGRIDQKTFIFHSIAQLLGGGSAYVLYKLVNARTA